MRGVVNRLLVLVMLCIPAVVQGKTSLALFNLTPASIDAIGLDGDLLFSMRKELERTQTYQLLSRRQMEEGLYRIGGAQVADTDQVISYGNDLGVNSFLPAQSILSVPPLSSTLNSSMSVIPGKLPSGRKVS